MALSSGAEAMNLASGATLVSFLDDDSVNTNYGAFFPTPPVHSAYWNHSWLIASTSGSGMDTGEAEEFTVNVKNFSWPPLKMPFGRWRHPRSRASGG